MEHLRQDSPTARWLAQHIPSEQPFTLVDIGCSGGLDGGWRVFGEKLSAYGFEPILAEVEALQRAEQNPAVHYIAGFVGSDPAEGPMPAWSNPREYPRLSYHRVKELRAQQGVEHDVSAISPGEHLSDTPLAEAGRSIYVPAELARRGVSAVDFVKIDCDGPDFEILKSLRPIFDGVLGATLEVNYLGTDAPDEHTFHNTDRVMRSLGFHLFGLSIRKYSAETLPFPFEMDHPVVGHTIGGRPYQGDAFYARHGGGPEADALSAVQLLKLASIFALFGLPDHSAEVLERHRARVSALVDVDKALDILCIEIQTLVPTDGPIAFDTYAKYQAAFDSEDLALFGAGQKASRRRQDSEDAGDALRAARSESDRLTAELAFVRGLLDRVEATGATPWTPLAGSFQSLQPAYANAEALPATFGTPAVSWAYGACSLPIAVEQPSTVRVTARAVRGKIGFCLLREDLGGLVSGQVAITPEDGVRTVFLDAVPQGAPVRLTIRNYDDDGLAGEVELIAVEIVDVAR